MIVPNIGREARLVDVCKHSNLDLKLVFHFQEDEEEEDQQKRNKFFCRKKSEEDTKNIVRALKNGSKLF
jgi:hypothetical protein